MAEKITMTPNFIQNMIEEDLKNGKYTEGIHTRFPPEPNGYLHIGHAKSICLNFGLAEYNHGLCNLRFDDTNPTKEDTEYVDSIQEDIRWLGFSWGNRKFYASDYFDKLYDFAVTLIKKGLAYVDDLSAEEIKAYRGTLTEPGKESPYRNRSVEENLDLFARMKAGEFADGTKVLRAKIDMASPNLVMRDTVIYRIAHVKHHRTGDKWCIYPMYDFAHPLSDAIEGITHSVCTLEFEEHRPFYDWLLDSLDFDPNTRPRQIEFARLNLTNTVTSKRKLRQLVEEGYVRGWDDPRMPTISGLRRRGYTPAAIRNFCKEIGVAKADSIVDVSMLEHEVRADLNENADRVMAVLHPLKVVITNYPEDKEEWLLAEIRFMVAIASCRSRARSTSSRRTSWKSRPRSTSASSRVERYASSTPTSSSARKSSRTQRAMSSSSTARQTLTPRRAARRPAARSRARSTGWPRRRPFRQKCASMTISSRRMRTAMYRRTSSRRSTRIRSKSSTMRGSSRP